MAEQPLQHEELSALLAALCDATIDDASFSRLEELLAADPKARQWYMAYMELHGELCWDHKRIEATEEENRAEDSGVRGQGSEGAVSGQGPVASEPVLKSGNPEISKSPIPNSLPTIILDDSSLASPFSSLPFYASHPFVFSNLFSLLVLGLGMLGAWMYQIDIPRQIAQDIRPKPSLNKLRSSDRLEFVGRITRMFEVKWAELNTSTETGNNVPLNRKYALASGLMEITYDTGAKVVLQGPCSYQVDSRDGGFLSIGKLTARLEKKGPEVRGQGSETVNHKSEIINHKSLAPMFAVRTPAAIVTDLGTEFGIDVGKEGQTTAHVFRGSIEVQPLKSNQPSGKKVVLVADQTLHIATDAGGSESKTCRIQFDPSVFVRVERLSEIADEKKLISFRRWETYSRRLRSAPSLLAYYDFQRNDAAPSLLPNMAENGGQSLDGRITGARWAVGRMYGKQALAFNGAESCVEINIPRKSDDLTLTAWLNIDAMEHMYNALIMSDGRNAPGSVSWYFRSEDFHSYFNILGARGPWRFSPQFSFAQFHHWMHLAVVFQHKNALVQFYKDGRLIDQYTAQGIAPVCIGPARIGHWNSPGYSGSAKDCGFSGRIDELAIFNRPLASHEIQTMFDAEKPLTQRDLDEKAKMDFHWKDTKKNH